MSLTTQLQTALNAGFRAIPGVQLVEVRQIDPDTGNATVSATDVTAKRLEATLSTPQVGETELPVESARWRLLASEVGFVPRKRDLIIEADDTVWVIGEEVRRSCLGTRYVCECHKVLSTVDGGGSISVPAVDGVIPILE